MSRLIDRVSHGPLRPYLGFLVPLLALAALIVSVMTNTGCGDDPFPGPSWPKYSSPDHGQDVCPSVQFRLSITGYSTDASPGEQANRVLQSSGGASAPPSGLPYSGQTLQDRAGAADTSSAFLVKYEWHPPQGATNFGFSLPPDPGGPPFVWRDRALGQAIEVTFNHMPQLPPGIDQLVVHDSLVVGPDPAGSYGSAVYATTLKRPGTSPPGTSAPQRAAPPGLEQAALSARTVWETNRWYHTEGVTMTTARCQDWVDLVWQDSFFFALRLPTSSSAPTQSYTLPVVLGPYSQTLELLDTTNWPPRVVISTPLELRFDRFDFAENVLPAAPGQHWVALGVPDGPITCPAGLQIPPGKWEIRSRTLLDLSEQPNNCTRCELLGYYCYEGQEAPLGASPAGVAPGKSAVTALDQASAASQAWGITCLGPLYDLLETWEAMQWDLHGASTVHVSPTVTTTLSVLHYVNEYVPGNLQVNPNYFSDLPVAWKLYGGTAAGLDLNRPLTLPLTVNASQVVWWRATVPRDTPSGAYTLVITGTSTAAPPVRHASDMIWVGDWVPPPLLPTQQRAYLPVVVRNR